MNQKLSTLPTGAKVTWWFLLILMAYFGLSSASGAFRDISLLGKSGALVALVVNLLQVIVSFGAVFAIWNFKKQGLTWLWAEVVFSGLLILLSFLSRDARVLAAGFFSLIFNIALGLLMVGGYKEVLKRATQKTPDTLPQ